MNLPKFEPLKRFFTDKKSSTEIMLLEAQVRMLQNALSEEEEYHKKIKDILINIIELESVNLPLPIMFDIFDYLHMDTVEEISK